MLELFTNPGFLAVGGALVGSPIIIHLINRLRFRRLRWAAMEFLLKSQKKNRRRLIIEQLLLLLLRILLVVLVTLLVARLHSDFSRLQQRPAMHVALIDDTLSMTDRWQQGDGQDSTAFKKAKQEVSRIAKKLSQSSSDRLMILPLSKVDDADYEPAIFERLDDSVTQDKVEEHLKKLKATKLHVDMYKGIDKLQKIKEASEDRVFLHILADYRQHEWTGSPAEPMHKAIKAMARNETKIWLRDMAYKKRQKGQTGAVESNDNIGITDFRPDTRVVGVDMHVYFTLKVKNYSAQEKKVRVKIYDGSTGTALEEVDLRVVDEVQPEAGVINVPAGSEVTATFKHYFVGNLKENEAEFAQLYARLENDQGGRLNDGLPGDDVRYTAVELRKNIPVLVIDGEGAAGREAGRDSFHIALAFESDLNSTYKVYFGDEEVRGEAVEALTKLNLRKYPTIFLLNVRSLTKAQREALENYVSNGGGVAFFLGPNVDMDYYTKKLYREGKGVFPAPLQAIMSLPKRTPEKGDLYQVFLRDDQFGSLNNVPILGNFMAENRNLLGLLKDLPVRKYYQVNRFDWNPGDAKELLTLPNDVNVRTYQDAGLLIRRQLQTILDDDKLSKKTEKYRKRLREYSRRIYDLLGAGVTGNEVRGHHLGKALEGLLRDQGDKKRNIPNLTEFWQISDEKIQNLKDRIETLLDRVKYGDPLAVVGRYGLGRVMAVMTTAGRFSKAQGAGGGDVREEWNQFSGGSGVSKALYPPFVSLTQNWLAGQPKEAAKTVGTPIEVNINPGQYKSVGKPLAMECVYVAAVNESNKDAKELTKVVSRQPIADSDKVFKFRMPKSDRPGLYLTRLRVQEEGDEEFPPLATWSNVFNVDTYAEGRLDRVAKKSIEADLLDKETSEMIYFVGPSQDDEQFVNREMDLSESPWLFLFLIGVLVAEQALAVHLSFHSHAGEPAGGRQAGGVAPRTA